MQIASSAQHGWRFLLRMWLLLAGCVLAGSAQASELGLILIERGKPPYTYKFDPVTFVLREAQVVRGGSLPEGERFKIQDGHLRQGDVSFGEAVEILYQCQSEGGDIVVVRSERTSLSSPAKLLSAAVGHPVQQSTIVVLKIDGGAVRGAHEIISRDSSYRWEARIVTVEDQP